MSCRCLVVTLASAALAWCAAVVPAPAEITRIEIERREPFADGEPFVDTGPYEKITGRLHGEVDPDDPANARITDLRLAPRNERGRVEYATDFFLLAPRDPRAGNGRLFYGVNNRGNKLSLSAFNDRGGNDPTSPADAGNGFLMRQGYAILWCGWNGDVRPGGNRLQIDLPIATHDGEPITGKVYAEICVNAPSHSEPFDWGNSKPYPAVSLDHRSAKLTMRPTRGEPAVELPHEAWSFARLEDDQPVPDPTHVYLEDGFRPGWLYELVYEARDPRVTGLGFAAVRDAVSFFRYGVGGEAGGDRANPLAGVIERAYVFGISQSGRFIHHFLYEDFNADEEGRLIFDGAIAHVGGAGKGQFNYRFAQTTRHGSHHEDNLYPADFFPLATVAQRDPHTGEEGDWLARARMAGHLPKLFLTETSTEYWARAASLLHTDVEGETDLKHDENVRIYFFTGAQHGVSRVAARGMFQNLVNTLDHRPLLRVLLVVLDEWVTSGREPPPSEYPRIDDGTLVDLETWRDSFPTLPGVSLPESFYAPLRLDPGPRWHTLGIADHVPPKAGPAYRTLIPAVDAEGVELAGIRLPDVAVPLATYAGWNLRGEACGATGMLARWAGSMWPLPRTAAERQQSGDPRPAILQRYPTRDDYLKAISEAADDLLRRRLLLAEDVERIRARAAEQDHWPSDESARASRRPTGRSKSAGEDPSEPTRHATGRAVPSAGR